METLVRQYEHPVYNVAYRMLGNAEDAADAAQTTFLKVIENLQRFDPEQRLFSWVYRIALNVTIDMLKRRGRSAPLLQEPVAQTPGPDEIAGTDQVSGELAAALLRLPEHYRAVIVLKYVTGCSYREIAQILELPEKTVRSRLYTARLNLKDCLTRQGVDGP